jgi:hypothetical protein
MLTEAKIILPCFDNSGNALNSQRVRIEESLLDHFGGFSSHASMGAWKDPKSGKVYYDESVTYAIAADWSQVENSSHIRWIAQNAAEIMSQECIYLSLPTGVEFVMPYEAAIAA